ncbi:MAG: molybdopterin-dependent oxidoreductase [Dehalococcoidia bacterium]|nr:molybdopterin-dependent oxidoreductase [Dehalococcoidia bacterium]
MSRIRLSRRDFLKALGAAGALSLGVGSIGATQVLGKGSTRGAWDEMPRLIPTVCGMCDARCGVLAYVVGDRLYKLEGNFRHSQSQGKICARGSAGVKLLYDPDRLKYPLKRVGEGLFDRISWDQAFREIGDKLAAIKDQNGPQALAWAFHPDLSELWDRRFMAAFGSPNIFTQATLGRASAQAASRLTLGWEPVSDLKNARYILLFGRNYAESMYYVAATNALMQAKEKGSRIVVVDPRLSRMASQAHEWIPIRPGTDGAMLLAMMNVLVAEGLYDAPFIEANTVGFQELRDFLADKTPAWASSICDVPAETIRRTAQEMAAARPSALVDMGLRGAWGATHANSFQTARAALALNALLGNYGAKGGLLPPPPNPLGRLQLPATPPLQATRADGAGGEQYPLASTADGIYQMLPEIILTSEPYPIRALIANHTNPARSLPNTSKAMRALSGLDLLVAIDTHLTDTGELAHYILPESTYLERLDPPSASKYLLQEVALRQPVVKALYDTKPAYEIIAGLAGALGMGDQFAFTIEDVIRESLRPLGMDLASISRDGLWREAKDPSYGQPAFPTPSGRIELYSRRLEESGYDALPVFSLPIALPREQDAFRLVQGRDSAHTGTATQNNAYLHALSPENKLWIGATRAARLGIKTGDWLTVSSAAGEVRIQAHVTHGIHAEAVFMVHGFGHNVRAQRLAYHKGVNDNTLISDAREPVAGGAATGETIVRVRRVR